MVEDKFEFGLTAEALVNYSPTHALRDQYVVGSTNEESGLELLYEAFPPQTYRVSAHRVKFIVFRSWDPIDMQNLASIWAHSSAYHSAVLRLYSLAGLAQKA
jgi:hypothetical protein